MYPESFPQSLEGYLRGEARVFEVLRNQLGDEWDVYHHVNWHLHPNKQNRQRDAEADFVVVHPQHGIFVLEVKGGIQIRYDAQQGKWFSTDHNLSVHEIKDPYQQAKENKYHLLDKLHESREGQERVYLPEDQLILGYAVFFPDVAMINGELPTFATSEITLLQPKLQSIEKALIQLGQYYALGKTINPASIGKAQQLIHKLLVPKYTLSRTMKSWFHEADQALIQLSEAQYSVLTGLQRVKRASIYGCAGSGKTLLAIRKAELLEKDEQYTLLLCFNTLLGEHLNRHFTGSSYVNAGSFYPVICDLLEIPVTYDNDAKLLELIKSSDIGYYDALIIDEAQDFTDSQLEILKHIHKQDGLLYYFWDNNQDVMRRGLNLSFDEGAFPYVLPENRRNSTPIFHQVMKHYHQDIPLAHVGIDGYPVRILQPYRHRNATQLFLRLNVLLTELIEDEKIDPSDIAILTFRSKTKTSLREYKPSFPYSLFDDSLKAPGIHMDTARRFKGMEASVVIVTELDDDACLANKTTFDDMCYVSFSRAKHLLIVLPPDNIDINSI
jgi:thymidine kinase